MYFQILSIKLTSIFIYFLFEDIILLSNSLSELTVLTRQMRTSLWCVIQIVLNQTKKKSTSIQISDMCINEDEINYTDYLLNPISQISIARNTDVSESNQSQTYNFNSLNNQNFTRHDDRNVFPDFGCST